MIDYTVRLGDVVSFVGFCLGGLSVIFMMKADIKALALKLGFLGEKVEIQNKEISRFAELLTLMGRYEERFASIRNDINDLKRGRGYIVKEKGND